MVVHPYSVKISRVPTYSQGVYLVSPTLFCLRDYHPLWLDFPTYSAYNIEVTLGLWAIPTIRLGTYFGNTSSVEF